MAANRYLVMTDSANPVSFFRANKWRLLKLAFHDADTDTDTDILVDILARIVARMSACRSACHSSNFRKSRVSDVSARILARISVSASASWNTSLIAQSRDTVENSEHNAIYNSV